MNKKSNPKDVKKGCLILIVLSALVIALISYTCNGEKLTRAEQRSQMINKLLHKNGANSVSLKIMALVKKDLNDPNSMGNLEVNYVDKDSVIFVSQKFTAKNAFGGTLTKEVIVSIDTLGNITNIHKWID